MANQYHQTSLNGLYIFNASFDGNSILCCGDVKEAFPSHQIACKQKWLYMCVDHGNVHIGYNGKYEYNAYGSDDGPD